MKSETRKKFDVSLFKTVGFWTSVGLSIAVLTFYILSRPEIGRLPTIGMLEIIEAKTLDLRFLLRGAREPKETIVIVAVDEKTEDALGRWQSSGRRWLAQLLDILVEGNAGVIGFDMTLAEPDEGVNLSMLDDLKQQYRAALPEAVETYPALLTYLEQAQDRHNYDALLAQAIQRAQNVVLGIYFLYSEGAKHVTPEQQDAYRDIISRVAYQSIQFPPGISAGPLQLRRYAGVQPNLPIFSDAARSFGFFNVVPDRDEKIRFSPLIVDYDGVYYPSLALEVARAYLNPPLPPIVHALGTEGGGQVRNLELGPNIIPCDEEGKLLIKFYGPMHTFPYYSFSDVISGVVPPHKFADKIVLVGTTSFITQDRHSTPFQGDGAYPGVEVNATIIENILRQDFLLRPGKIVLFEAAIIFLLGVVLGVARHERTALWGVWTALIGLLCILGAAYGAFVFADIWVNVTFPMLFIGIDYLTITSYKYFTEEKQKRGIKKAFQHYVSATVVDEMLQRADTLKLGGERKHLTVLFSDIRGFTPISEKMSPEALVAFLNEYLTEMTDIVMKHGGTVDKYMGDAIMAFYGAPVALEEHASQACQTAVDMILRLRQLGVDWEARGLPPIQVGVGINTGDMNVGNMGSRERFDYTVMGDHVNLASRLEGLNKYYGTSIIISEYTYNTCTACREQSWTVRELDTVRVKGRNEPVTIYELIGYGHFYEQKQELAHAFKEALHLYKERQWQQAQAQLQAILQRNPADGPATVYAERCAEFIKQPPPDDWDGVFNMQSK